ncbi:MAG: LacI family DNA-binding transcriptional regulator [Oscillospiraceae bacterium]|nr:LacI family DNA-binding transcriptional regulator [Oscillospiraceae bacterium]
MKEKKATISSVAKLAGVSNATVSYVLTGNRNVSPKTKKRIQSAMQELDYRPNIVARSLKTGRNHLIGLVVPDVSTYYYGKMVEKVESVVIPRGYTLLVANTKERLERELHILETFSSSLVDGLILSSCAEKYEDISSYISNQIPMLFIDRKPSGCTMNSVTTSSYAAVCNAMIYLFENGHSNIGYLSEKTCLSDEAERFNAYKDSLSAHGIPYNEKQVMLFNRFLDNTGNNLKSLIDEGCTAIIIGNQVMTFDAFSFAVRTGIKLGTDVEIIGFHDPYQEPLANPGRPVIEEPASDMETMAATEIISMIEATEEEMVPSDKILVSRFRLNI